MDPRYEVFTLADAAWYEPLERCDDADSLLRLAHEDLPPGWRRRSQGVWTVLAPEGPRAIPDQGWKIHVSSTPESHEEVVRATWEICRKLDVPWKFLRSRKVVTVLNTKYADRASSGKSVTVYPHGDEQLRTLVEELNAELAGVPGPYILSDLRWRQGPVSVRYGAFVALWCELPDGTWVPALRNPDGGLVPDVRRPVFTVPDWVEVPSFLTDDTSDGNAGLLGGYRVVKALHFSNAGGVYVAESPDGEQVVLKEARPHAGLDTRGVDAVTRLRHEYEVMSRLSHLSFVPQIHGYFTEWEHHYLAMEYVPGETFSAWMGKNAPVTQHRPTAEKRRAYGDEVCRVVGKLEECLGALHDAGYAFGDLHPHNIVLRPDGAVSLIDFELASPVDAPRDAALGAPGFVHSSITDVRDADWFALGCCQLAALTSLTPLISRSPAVAGQLMAIVEETFPELPAHYLETMSARMRLAPGLPADLLEHRPLKKPDTEGLVRGIVASATTDRTDRLYPGDISLYRPGAGLGLAHGAAGVLHSLYVTNGTIPEPHLEWLVRRAREAAVDTPLGLYNGLAGTAWLLQRIGHPDARHLVERVASSPLPQSPGLFSGLTGIAHLLLDAGWKEEGLRLAGEVADRIGGRGLLERPGLMRGWSGPAVLMARCAHMTGSSEWARAADSCVHLDMRHGRMVDGMLQMHSSNRLLPYLAEGSAGVALAALGLPDTAESDLDVHSIADAAARAASIAIAVQGGLFNGRAGLAYFLAQLSAVAPQWRPLLDTQLRSLDLHISSLAEGTALVGDQLLRLSTDLATGSAGALLALAAAERPGKPLLPGAHTIAE
ncbi:class III lanthionine synthetase LanKC [Streptomyces mobaraensis]|uniref:class III lanthionine synthetase LanKC n=1 Tax=Streptomyces mobaraensis TaxID=35621 RepID=UPI00331E022C